MVHGTLDENVEVYIFVTMRMIILKDNDHTLDENVNMHIFVTNDNDSFKNI